MSSGQDTARSHKIPENKYGGFACFEMPWWESFEVKYFFFCFFCPCAGLVHFEVQNLCFPCAGVAHFEVQDFCFFLSLCRFGAGLGFRV